MELLDVGHTPVRERAEEYEERVIAFLRRRASTRDVAAGSRAKEPRCSRSTGGGRGWYDPSLPRGLAVMLFHLTEDTLVHKENGSSLAARSLGSRPWTCLPSRRRAALSAALALRPAAIVLLIRRLASVRGEPTCRTRSTGTPPGVTTPGRCMRLPACFHWASAHARGPQLARSHHARPTLAGALCVSRPTPAFPRASVAD